MRPRDPRPGRGPSGLTAGGPILAWLLAVALLLAGGWGAMHRVAHGALAPVGLHLHALGPAGQALHHHHPAAPGTATTPGLLSAVDSHESATDTCRLLDQLACADGLLVATPAPVPSALAVAAEAACPAGTAAAPAAAYSARAPPAAPRLAAARA